MTGSINTNAHKNIRDGNYVHSDINAKYDRLKICDRIIQTQSECKGSELSEKRTIKFYINYLIMV